MKEYMMIVAGVFLFSLSSVAGAQDQQTGQQLTFPKGEVTEHPSDLHLGTDPYYKQAPKNYEGTDEKGYKRDYDPSMQYYEETTTYKRVKGKKGKTAPEETTGEAPKTDEAPARWQNTQ